MESYKSVVMEHLQLDKAVFLHTDCSIRVDGAGSENSVQEWTFDAVAIDLRHRAVYLCDVACALQDFLKNVTGWASNWDNIKSALQRECKLPESWRIHAWLFVPRDTIEELDSRLEDLRRSAGCPFKVKITSLEDAQPWRSWTWSHFDPLGETTIRGGEGI